MLATGRDPARLDEAGELVIGPLTAEDLPAEVDQLREELTALLPFAPIVSVLIELDRRTGFLDCFTHAGRRDAAAPGAAVDLAGAAGPVGEPHPWPGRS